MEADKSEGPMKHAIDAGDTRDLLELFNALLRL